MFGPCRLTTAKHTVASQRDLLPSAARLLCSASHQDRALTAGFALMPSSRWLGCCTWSSPHSHRASIFEPQQQSTGMTARAGPASRSCRRRWLGPQAHGPASTLHLPLACTQLIQPTNSPWPPGCHGSWGSFPGAAPHACATQQTERATHVGQLLLARNTARNTARLELPCTTSGGPPDSLPGSAAHDRCCLNMRKERWRPVT